MSAPAREPQPRMTGAAASLGNGMKVSGRIESNEDLYIDAEVDGEVQVPGHRLTIGPNATVRADIQTFELVSMGTIHGNVDAAEKIELRKGSHYAGDLKTARLVVEDGAFLNGRVEMARARDEARHGARDEAVDFDTLVRPATG